MRRASWTAALFTAMGICLMASSATAQDVTFDVTIKGTVHLDGVAAVGVNCNGGSTVTFGGGAASLDTLPAFTLDPTCGLDSAAGVFSGGELFNGLPIGATTGLMTVLDRRGDESYQKAFLSSTMATGAGNITMTLVYKAKFPKDRSAGTILPPIAGAKGMMILENTDTGHAFVGKFNTLK